MGLLGNIVDATGTALHLPEWGISEKLGSTGTSYPAPAYDPASDPLSSTSLARVLPGTAGQVQGVSTTDSSSALGTGLTPTQIAAQQQASQDATTKAQNAGYLNDQMSQLRSLLARTDTALSHGLTQNQDQYDTQYGGATTDKEGQITGQTQAKRGAYDTINRNASNGYRSLAQIIGRAGGTGSSAFRELLPDVVGKDTSSKRQNASSTYGQNLSNIDTSFESVVADLMRQKKANEESLRSGIEGQRQGINGQLSTLAGQLAQNDGGDFNAVKAAQTPFQQAIDQSRNQVEGFFNDFRTPYTKQAVNPNLAAYQTDRSAVNAQAQGADPSNPYSSLLRKKLQGVA